jgi:hypothetical protein
MPKTGIWIFRLIVLLELFGLLSDRSAFDNEVLALSRFDPSLLSAFDSLQTDNPAVHGVRPVSEVEWFLSCLFITCALYQAGPRDLTRQMCFQKFLTNTTWKESKRKRSFVGRKKTRAEKCYLYNSWPIGKQQSRWNSGKEAGLIAEDGSSNGRFRLQSREEESGNRQMAVFGQREKVPLAFVRNRSYDQRGFSVATLHLHENRIKVI